MAYQALYRKYRPASFDDVIGQDYIITILRNQIMNGHAAHAYLFCGTRGTGKTSAAKIFARAINCLEPIDGSPCGVCDACIASVDSNPDIIEMDAASNTGVDDIRSILDKAIYLPIRLTRKIYIIDEAHMMSTNAFNALLKTLEEPPEHVVFILATTEPQKIPATVISRCQRLDFRRISVKDITECVKKVLTAAKLFIDDEGLLAIARCADGSMRDALSLADQCVSFCGNHVTADLVYSVLGAVDGNVLFNLANALSQSTASEALRQLQEIIASGRDLGVLIHDLATHFRALMMAKICGHCSDMLDCTEDTMSMYIEQANNISKSRILRAIDILMKTQNDMRWITLPRLLVEGAFIHICNPETEATVESLTDRLDQLESKLNNKEYISEVKIIAASANESPASAVASKQESKLDALPLPTPTEYTTAFFDQFIRKVKEVARYGETLEALLRKCCKRYFFSESAFVLSFEAGSGAFDQLSRLSYRKSLEETLSQLDSSYRLVIASEAELVKNADDLQSFLGSYFDNNA